MSEPANGDTQTLADLRQKIDAIDAELHRLLIDRGAVVGALIEIKGTSNPANAFRPGREADMMRRLVAAHSGVLPVTTVEHIWREIITTFTRMQAPFDIAVDTSLEPERMRDLARFYFGFSVNLDNMPDANAVVARVGENGGLGLVSLGQPQDTRPWWRGLVGDATPRIMSHVPFIRTRQRQGDRPALVVSPPLADPAPPDVVIYAVTSETELPNSAGFEVLSAQKSAGNWDSLVAAPAVVSAESVASQAGTAVDDIVTIGGVARGIALDGPPSILYAAAEIGSGS